MFDFSLLKKTLADLSGGLNAKRDELETLKQQRAALDVAPGAREDVLDIILKQIDDAADRYVNRLQASIAKTSRYGVRPEIGPGGRALPVAVATARDNVATAPRVEDIEASLCFLMRPQMKEAVTLALKAMDWPADAEPIQGRADRLAKLDNKIAALEAEVQALREEAGKAGILV